jgi:MraZ protein
MFRGAQQVTMDAKGRIMLPARLRQLLDAFSTQDLVLTIDVAETCLLAYPLKAWENIEAALLDLPNLDPQTRAIQRLILGHATELVPDATGRVLIPGLLNDYAKLSKNVILLGQGNKFEIWDAAHWHKRSQEWIKDGIRLETLTDKLKGVSL